MADDAALEVVRRNAVPFDADTAAARLLDAIDADATIVLIGEATHGTHEFYRYRADLTRALAGPRPERAIGVIYRPDTERASHYFSARLPEQFAAVVHVDRTRALEPLERWARHEADLPETYPTGV